MTIPVQLPAIQTPNVIHYYSPGDLGISLIPDFKVNNVDDDHNHQWHADGTSGSSEVGCGVSKNANSRIMGGLDPGYGQFPRTAHILSLPYLGLTIA